MISLVALEPSKLEVFMAVHGFAKIVEFSLLKLQERGKHKQQEHEVHRVGKEIACHVPFHKNGL